MTRQLVRRLGLLSLSAVLVLGVSACGGGSTAAVQEVQRTCAQLESQLSKEPGVVRAEVNFLHTGVNPGDARVLIQVTEPADETALTELATRLIWKSDLEPLERISVTVGTGAPTTYDVPQQRAELERRYGSRPSTEEEFDVGQATLALAGAAAVAVLVVLVLIVIVVVIWRRRARRP